MFILLNENLLSRKLKQPLIDAGHLVRNVEEMGWRGAKDRELLALVIGQSFDVFITADKNLPYQQNLRGLALRIVVLNTASTSPSYLLPLMFQISDRLESLAVGSVTLISDTGEATAFNADSET
ncbi:MAG: hypothetical protein HC840_17955 [Leptolyngbyaceae cyanobacterium RM2_2_4]|nr:hypothetical protein [Leptolyngbyaceae cyanobacterium RM2_2_4]